MSSHGCLCNLIKKSRQDVETWPHFRAEQKYVIPSQSLAVMGFSALPKATLTKPPFPIFRFVLFFSRCPSARSAFPVFLFCCFSFVLAACPRLICMFRIFYGLNMRKNGMTAALPGMGLGEMFSPSQEIDS